MEIKEWTLEPKTEEQFSIVELSRLQSFCDIANSFYSKHGMTEMVNSSIELHDKLAKMIRERV